MSVFGAIIKQAPPGTVVVPLSAFDAAWQERPKSDVCIGLRNVAEDDLQTARQSAANTATRLHPKALAYPDSAHGELWAQAYGDALVRWVIARGTCEPNDIGRAWSGWAAAPEDMVFQALTPNGVQLVFDAWERMRIGTDITIAEATDEDVVSLASHLAILGTLPRHRAARVRRLIKFCLEELGQDEST